MIFSILKRKHLYSLNIINNNNNKNNKVIDMGTLSVSVPDELREKMVKLDEINWSAVARCSGIRKKSK